MDWLQGEKLGGVITKLNFDALLLVLGSEVIGPSGEWDRIVIALVTGQLSVRAIVLVSFNHLDSDLEMVALGKLAFSSRQTLVEDRHDQLTQLKEVAAAKRTKKLSVYSGGEGGAAALPAKFVLYVLLAGEFRQV